MAMDNPILRREFVSSTRSLKANLLLWGYLVLLASALLVLWPSGGVLSVASSSGRRIFALFFGINLTLLILLVPAFAATSITFERENNTFSGLFLTLLSPFEIVLGKLTASLAMLFFLALFSIPIASVCALTGGIGVGFTLKVSSILFLAAVSYGMMGLACSASLLRSSSAIMLNYVLILLFSGATWLPAVLLGDLLPGLQGILRIVRSFSPYDALFYLIYPESYQLATGAAEEGGGLGPYGVFLVFSCVLTGISLLVFVRKMLNPPVRKAIRGGMYDGASKVRKRRLSWPFYLIDPLKRKKNIGRWANPVFVAEMRNKLFANPKFVLRTVSAIFILSLGVLLLVSAQYATEFDPDTLRVVSIVFQLGVVALLAPSVGGGLITDEVAAGTLMSMRMTMITPLKMTIGKLKATFFYAMIFMVSSSAVIFVMAYLEPQNVWPSDGSVLSGAWWSELSKMMKSPTWFDRFWSTYHRVGGWIVILILSATTFLSAGLFASAISRTTSVATAISYSIAATICLVSFAPVVLGAKLAHGLAGAVLSLNPIAAAIQVTSGSAFSDYPGLWQRNIWILLGLTLFFITGATVKVWWLFNKMD